MSLLPFVKGSKKVIVYRTESFILFYFPLCTENGFTCILSSNETGLLVLTVDETVI